MSLPLALLGLLHEGEKSGYELVREFDYDRSVIWPAPSNEVYRELAKLARSGWIRERERGPRGRRRFAITSAGRAHLQQWLAETPADFTLRYEPILRAVFMTAASPAAVRARLERDLPFYETQWQILRAAERRQSKLPVEQDPRRFGRRQALALYAALRKWTQGALRELSSKP